MKRMTLFLCIAIIIILSVGCRPEPEPPEIPEEAMDSSADVVQMYGEVEDAEVIVEDNRINFYILPTDEQEVSAERWRELSEFFLRAFGANMVDEGLQGPTDESYGEVFDYYDAEIIVEGHRGAVLHHGTKNRGQNEIQWQE